MSAQISGARKRALGVLAAIATPLLFVGCGNGNSGSLATTGQPCPSGQPVVVALENFWGSIATQLGGDKVCVRSVIASPDTDPHAYEPKPSDARLIAGAKYVIVNGAGYDPWGPKLLDANPVAGRTVLTIADLVGKKVGDNPHLWYSPGFVGKVIDRISADLGAIVSQDASYFDQQKTQYTTVALKDYFDTINTIRQKYQGTPVGASESIFVYLSDALGLDLITPPQYLKAISEGTDPSASDKATVDQQIANKSIKVLVFNTQNSTKEVAALVDRAKAKKIPVAEVTETLTPASATFQDWQTRQLKGLLTALGS